MCGIAGFVDFDTDYTNDGGKWEITLKSMLDEISHRGQGENGKYIGNFSCLGCTRPSKQDLKTGNQPIFKRINGSDYVIVCNGELYNTDEIKIDLKKRGYTFTTQSDSELILLAFIEYGDGFVNMLNGIFSFAIWDGGRNIVYLFRDRLGVKPLFYTLKNGCLVFASEIKALFKFPDISPLLDKDGLRELFGLGPARTPGTAVFKDISEVLPGHFVIYNSNGLKQIKYWDLVSKEHTDSYEDTIDKVSFLIRDTVKRQLVSDVPVSSLLSGGIDSSIVTAIAATYLKEEGTILNTFSFDFSENDKYFKSNAFQPERDRPYVEKMLKLYGTNHTFLECKETDLFDLLYDAVCAKDLPGMADIDSSLLYFCRLVKEHNSVALTGECADEIFGGYPWFHKQELLEKDGFPWSYNIETRKMFLSLDLSESLGLDEYVKDTYEQALKAVPALDGENASEKRRREIGYLSIRWFMATLLERMGRMSTYAGLEARVPFADHRIMEYVFNVPWDMKYKDGIVKNLLRQSGKGFLPDELLYRKKSPYPKTYNPKYEQLLVNKLKSILNDKNSPLNDLINKEAVAGFLEMSSDYGKPWYGQLMAGPQMMAYLIQIEYWLKKYNLSV